MKIGIPTEIKNGENRVALPPMGVLELINSGHEVYVQSGAGLGSSLLDKQYEEVGAHIVQTASEAWNQDMVLKVKEPLAEEYTYFRKGLVLFTYLHLAANLELTKALMESQVTALAYESVKLPSGELPLLTPMSEIAGRLSTQIGARQLEKHQSGKGILMGGVPGVRKSKVTVIGGGVSGYNAANIALGMGADVTILDVNVKRLQELDQQFNGKVKTLYSNAANIQSCLEETDLAIGAVLIPGRKAPKLVSVEMVQSMPKHSVIIDIAIDQGGIFETVDHTTTHDEPTYEKYGIIHYAVANMPGAVPQTATYALSNATLPYILKIANMGFETAIQSDGALLSGVNTLTGHLVNEAIALDLELKYTDIETIL